MTLTDLPERIRSKILVDEETGCWLWRGACDTSGYGLVRYEGPLHKAHRLVYTLLVGPIARGMRMCHHCDTPPCVNPTHLFQGTAADNAHDRDRKGRQRAPLGEKHPGAKLTEETVRRMRAEWVPGSTTSGIYQLAAKYGVSFSAVHRCVTRETWRHVA